MNDLTTLGWDAFFSDQPLSVPETTPARVLAQQRGHYRVACSLGPIHAQVAGRLLHNTLSREDLPAVGDWVRIRLSPSGDRASIRAVYQRKSALIRAEAGPSGGCQILAANLDYVGVVCALNQELNLRRLERYLICAWESGAQPLVLLNKSDLCDDLPARLAEVEAVAAGSQVLALSALHGEGLRPLRELILEHRTLALVGSSGVGKSTLTNSLLGAEVQLAAPVREGDDRGRHTTTSRETFQVPGGGVLIDTPGMRELGLWEAGGGLESSFPEVEEFARSCRFRDCTHEHEPGCGVLEALGEAKLEPDRYESFLKLRREQTRLARKLDKRAQAQETQRRRQLTRHYRRRARVLE